MVKDRRYLTVKILIDAGHVKSLLEVFDTLPRSILARDFGTNYSRFSRLIENPDQFKLKEVYTLAKLLDIDELKMLTLVHNHYMNTRLGRKSR
jgi:hypothetical protein